LSLMDPLDQLRAETADNAYGLRLGYGAKGAHLFAPPEHACLVVGPPRCGKTSAVVVPNIVSACGPVVATSTKSDLLATTASARRRVGECLVFDPAGKTTAPPGCRLVGWSPVSASETFDRAVLTAEAMVLSARGGGGGEGHHWSERAQALLAPAFHAAFLESQPMARLLSLVDRREGREITAVLARHDSGLALDTFTGVMATEERELSAIWSTASSVLSAYRSERALEACEKGTVCFEEFVRSGSTLYVCSGADDQAHSAPIVSGLLRQARLAGYEAAAAGELGAATLHPPCLFLLDEVANIAPLHDLPSLVAEGGGQGVVTLACLQDLSQATARWGRLGEGFVTLFNTKVIFPGIGDRRTLEALSVLAGDHEVEVVSLTEGPRAKGLPGLFGRRLSPQATYSTRRQPRLPPDAIAQGLGGGVVGFAGASPFCLEARPWFKDAQMTGAVLGRIITTAFEPRPAGRRRRLPARGQSR
jgi:type IV secretion system protein VirD4